MITCLSYMMMMTLCVGLTQADRILLHSPEKHTTFQPGDKLPIEYTVRFEGMAKLGSASVSIHRPDHTVLTYLPAAKWTSSPTGYRGANSTWTIPDDIEQGKYLLRIAGPATYLCSANENGQAPYNRCHMTIQKTRHFHVSGNDPEEQLQEQVHQLEELQRQVQEVQEEQNLEIQEQQEQTFVEDIGI